MKCWRTPILVRLMVPSGGGSTIGRQWKAPAGSVIADLRVIVYGASGGSGVRWSATQAPTDDTDDPALRPAEADALGVVQNADLAFEVTPNAASQPEPIEYVWQDIASARLRAIQLTVPGGGFNDVMLTAAVVLVPDCG